MSSISPSQVAQAAPLPPGPVGSPVALDLGTQGSALLMAQGNAVLLLGDAAATHLLAHIADVVPVAGTEAATASMAATSEPLVIGSVAAPEPFSDAFAGNALDPRWQLIDPLFPSFTTEPGASNSAAAQVAQGTLTLSALTTTNQQVIAVTQSAPTRDFSATVHVTPGVGWNSSSAGATTGASEPQAGLVLALDDWNRMTLALRRDATVALCATTTTSTTIRCSAAPLPIGTTLAQGIYLRISQRGATVTGQVSSDGSDWSPVGDWSVAWQPSPGTAGAYAPPYPATGEGISPADGGNGWLTFTSMGLFVADTEAPLLEDASAEDSLSAQFNDFTVDVD